MPPRGTDLAGLKSCPAALDGAVHAIYVPESEDGPRLSSLAACGHLMAAGAEPIMALLTRDMNRIALQASILGAVSVGVRSILCTTGRHQTLTTSGSARGVFDVDPVQLVRIADTLRKSGELADGTKIDAPVELVLGVDTNPFSDPVELQVATLEKAVNAGADFVMTQPVFNLDRFNVWMSHLRERGLDKRVCVIASVMPLASAQEAIHLAETFTRFDIRDEDVARLDTAQDQRAAGIHLASETIAYLRKVDGVRGVHLMTGEQPSVANVILNAVKNLGPSGEILRTAQNDKDSTGLSRS
jgi:methylenetetrahydrofolate reductase (NADPH)